MRTSVKNLMSEIIKISAGSKNKLVLLDFDGTLVDFTSYASDTVMPHELAGLLKEIDCIDTNKLVIITGRRKEDIDRLIGKLSIDIIAEHGARIRENGIWRTLVDGSNGWKKDIIPVLRQFSEISENAYIEEKTFSLAWHFRNVETKTGIKNSQKLVGILAPVAQKNNLRLLNGKKVVEIIDKNVNKGFATKYLIDKYRFDFVLSIGDDNTDEDMFSVLRNFDFACTVKIGSGKTCAKFKLDNVDQVNRLLEQFQILIS